MGVFILRKAGAALIVVFLASVLVFLGVRALPGDPALAFAARGPRPEGARGDPREVRPRRASARSVRASGSGSPSRGISARTAAASRSSDTIVTRLPMTLELAFLSAPDRRPDRHPRGGDRRRAARQGVGLRRQTAALFGLSVPHFWLGLLMIILFAVDLRLAPGRRLCPVPRGPDRQPRSTC